MNVVMKTSEEKTTVAHPLAEPGFHDGSYFVRVTDVPDTVPVSTVYRQYMQVIVLPLDHDQIPWAKIENQPAGKIVWLNR
jgi:hypothetical protein